MDTNKEQRDKVVYIGDKADFQPKETIVNGEPMMVYPTYYKRVYANEQGGVTTELSLTPFNDDPTKKDNSR